MGLARLDCPRFRRIGGVVENELDGWACTRRATSEKLGNTSLGRGVGPGAVVVVFGVLACIEARDPLAGFVGGAALMSVAVVCLLKGIARGCALGRRGSGTFVPFRLADEDVPLALPPGIGLGWTPEVEASFSCNIFLHTATLNERAAGVDGRWVNKLVSGSGGCDMLRGDEALFAELLAEEAKWARAAEANDIRLRCDD